MNKNLLNKFELNPRTGMTAGIFFGALIALIVSSVTGDQSVWAWAIPVGLASGLAIGAGKGQDQE